ncbi:hypothetical protein [Micromonospora carbonacea]|uniref:Uncharacterized protein n=1 Tax=Micromonospora carbonacea TaxID=47853 RepID=A0A1C4WZI1_9ACTN|nr:hypothetical protein [Micromonospora carbonacea]SCF01615.1 hypothetical protein GA0070563_104131 [Micromonospora carbonacea]
MCRAYQIPHSTFLGWSHDDRSKAIWQYVREKQRCRGCGTRPDEWQTDHGGHQHAYRPVVDRCRGCELLETEREQLAGKPTGSGVFVRLERRD